MKTFRLLALIVCTVAPIGVALAETLVVDDQVQVRQSSVDRPARGITMTAVEKKFGEPTQKHAAVGGCGADADKATCRTPPITRWDYPGFTVIFEYDHVVESVVTG